MEMPTYEFRCPEGHEFEKFYRTIGGAEAKAACPTCGQLSERMMSAAGFAFKGSGFYLTDYGKNAHRDKGTPAPGSSGSGGDGAKGDGAKGDGATGEGKADNAKADNAKSEGSKSEGSKSEGSSPAGNKESSAKRDGVKSESGGSTSGGGGEASKAAPAADSKPAAAPAKKRTE